MARRFGKTPKEYRREVSREEADKRRSDAYYKRLQRYHAEMSDTTISESRKQQIRERQQQEFITTFGGKSSSTSNDDALALILIALGMVAVFVVVLWALVSALTRN